MDPFAIFTIGIVLLIVGIIIIVIALILASISGKKEDKLRGAGVIMIGPIPIIFGTDKKSVKSIIALALALTVVVLIIMIFNYWLPR